MSRPKVVFWLGNYSIRSESPSGIGQRLIQIVRGLRGTCEIKVTCTRMEVEPNPTIAEVLTTDIRPALSWGNVLYGFDNVPAEILEGFGQEGKVIVAENHTPIEHCYYQLDPQASVAVHRAALSTYRTQLRVADKFVVRSQAERIAVLDGLCLSGRIDHASIMRDESLSRLVEIIPIGILNDESPDLEPSCSQGSKVVPIIWNGGLYDFHDPVFLIEALASLARQEEISLLFPFPAATETHVMRSLRTAVGQHSLEGSVSIGCVKDARQALRSGTALIACVGRLSAENELCQRLRTREIFRFRSPMIVDGYGATGAWIRARRIGVVLNSDVQRAAAQIKAAIKPGNHRLLVEAIDRHRPDVLLDQPLAALGEDLRRLLSERQAFR